MQLGELGRRALAVARAVVAAVAVVQGRLGALCWSLATLSLPLPLPGWRRVLATRPAAPSGPRREWERHNETPTPTSVNYHFTRQCNYKCGFCFHTAKTSFVLPLEEAKRGLAMLKEAGEAGGAGAGAARRGRDPWDCPAGVPLHTAAVRLGSVGKERAVGRQSFTASFSGLFLGMEKINFSGGEPFLQDRGEFVGRLVQFCKQELKLPSVSIVSNGSLIREWWFKKYGKGKPRCAEPLAGFGSLLGAASPKDASFRASGRWFVSASFTVGTNQM